MAKEVVVSNTILYSVFANGTLVNGNVLSDNDLRIDGVVDGNVTCRGKLVLGTHAVITGDVLCDVAEISGRVKGKLEVTDGLTLRQTALIEGNITASTLIVEAGALFNGTCRMQQK
ncbi:MAG: polymer-forming cytoskeletal protein [Bacteroidales bacterium]|jgi:cytoskeletal protein CcmA (bactofilin family)|nr:polymer-forming cytoskeletal protein [Bacteroidales bacterium]MDD3166332.1 polymer-forming cytoskeletal protein [Bacteroidales bacterium]MDD4770891.1 polymer-forming cytoskeletal protein [Bacteroidales bacterium]HKL91825.1 polymer-forming cytoskeletal protein [Bacteroidales bacterium]